MNRSIHAFLLSVVTLLSGCDRPPAPTQTLVVDPVPVARSLGRDQHMQQQLSSALEQLNTQLKRHGDDLAAQIDQEKGKLGKNPSEESLTKFRELVAAASQNLQQTELLARQKAADYRQALLGGFNNELRAAAMDIARERGATSVLVLGPDVLWFDPSADITADVIARMRADAALPAQPVPAAAADSAERRELEKLEAVVESIEKQQKPGQPATQAAPGND
ncbi:MAG: OmpH family outer membrane protein [Gammaproteobacteria bacterium]